MSRRSFKFEDIQEAFDFVSFGQPMEQEAYLSLATGAIHLHSEYGDTDPLPEDIDDPAKYLSIPHKNELGLGKRLALRFVAEYTPDDFEDVRDIFSRRGAYSKFKELLESRPEHAAAELAAGRHSAMIDVPSITEDELVKRIKAKLDSKPYQRLFTYDGANVLFAQSGPKKRSFVKRLGQQRAERQAPNKRREEPSNTGERFVKGFLRYVQDPGSELGTAPRGETGSTQRNR